MATFTKRVDASLRNIYDRYNTHWTGDGWKADPDYGQLGHTTEFESDGDWYGGIKNASLRFIGVTIPQGSVITSAKITFTDNSSGSSRTLNYKITGVDEDNTAEFDNSPIDTARTRTHTTAIVDWDATFSPSIGTTRDTADITSVIQEIIDRAGWTSGNAIGLYVYDDGTSVSTYYDVKYYSSYPSDAPLLTINYLVASISPSISPSPSVSPSPASVSPSVSPSVSKSPSISPSVSPSISLSPSASPSISPSISPSVSASPSIPPAKATVLRVAKTGINALTNSDPEKMIFDSQYGTLKYFDKKGVNITFDASTGDISAKGELTHNLSYYPFCEVFVRVYTGSTPSGNYEYCPFAEAGASIFYSANYKITTDKITVYGMIDGVSSSVWHFDFLIFVYKNNLQL